MHFYLHHIGDFNNATRHLTRIERAIYRDLLEIYYDTESPLPNDMQRIARVALIADDERSILRDVLNEFFTLGPDGFRNKRADAEISAYRDKVEKAKVAAAASVSARAERRVSKRKTPVQRTFNGRSTDVQQTMNHEPRTSNQEPVTKREGKNTAPGGVDSSVWSDFQKLRQSLRAPITDTVMAGIQREADKAGVTLEDALRTCCERGWRGFKAAWMAEQPKATGEPAWRKERADMVAKHFPNIAEKKHGLTIDVG